MSVDTSALARRVRIHVLRMTSTGGSAHVGSALSIVDVLAVLYGSVVRIDAREPAWSGRDRVILSKGHAGAAMYATLAECGFFPLERLAQHYQDGSDLSGHVSHKGIPGVELSTGSLGHGLSIGAGLVLAAQRDGRPNRAFVILSDGECDEGSVWEAAMFAAHHRLHQLTAIVDYNKLQSLDLVENTLALEPFADKWRAFGWDVVETDGHDHDELKSALTGARSGRPRVCIAHTTKGKGVSFMENKVLWHYRTAKGDEFDRALAELQRAAP